MVCPCGILHSLVMEPTKEFFEKPDKPAERISIMARPKLEEYDVAGELGATTAKEEGEKKIKSVDQVMKALKNLPPNHKAIMPSLKHYSDPLLHYDVRIALAEKRVEKAREDREDYQAGLTPEGKAKRDFQKFTAKAKEMAETLKSLGIDPASIPLG